MVSKYASGGVFSIIGVSFKAILRFGVPLYGIIVQNMNDTSLRSLRSQVIHEVFINKTRDQDGFAHRRRAQVRDFFRFAIIWVVLVSLN